MSQTTIVSIVCPARRPRAASMTRNATDSVDYTMPNRTTTKPSRKDRKEKTPKVMSTTVTSNKSKSPLIIAFSQPSQPFKTDSLSLSTLQVIGPSWTNGSEISLKVPVYTGISPWSALLCSCALLYRFQVSQQ